MFERLMEERQVRPRDPSMTTMFDEENPFYVTLRDFSAQVGSGFRRYFKGQILTDFSEIQCLNEMNAPISLYRERGSYVSCPQCAHVFPINLDPAITGDSQDASAADDFSGVKQPRKGKHGAHV